MDRWPGSCVARGAKLIARNRNLVTKAALCSGPPFRPVARNQPMHAVLAQLALRRLLIAPAILRGKHIAPAPIRALVDEGLGAAVPEDAPARYAVGGVGLHVIEAAVLQDRRPAVLVYRNVKEVGDP